MDAPTILIYVLVPAWAALVFLNIIADDVRREDTILKYRFDNWKRDEKRHRREEEEVRLREEARRRRPRNADSPFVTHDDAGDEEILTAEPAAGPA